MLVSSIFSIYQQCFYTYSKTNAIIRKKIELSSKNFINMEESKIVLCGNGS